MHWDIGWPRNPYGRTDMPDDGNLPICPNPAAYPLVLRHARDAERLEHHVERLRSLYEAQRHLIRCLDGERSATRMYAAAIAPNKADWDRDWVKELGDAMHFCQGRTYRARKALQEMEGRHG